MSLPIATALIGNGLASISNTVGGPDLIFLLFSLLIPVLTIWMAIDCALNEPSTGNDKIVWLLIILMVPMFGALSYLLIRRPRRSKISR